VLRLRAAVAIYLSPTGERNAGESHKSRDGMLSALLLCPAKYFWPVQLEKKTETVGIKFTKATEINDNEHILY